MPLDPSRPQLSFFGFCPLEAAVKTFITGFVGHVAAEAAEAARAESA